MAVLRAKPATPGQFARFRAATVDMPNRSTTGRFTEREMAAFLAGQWVGCHVSTWVRAALWDAERGTLWLRFEAGWQEPYLCSEATAIAFAQAPSKGGFSHDYLI